MEELQPSLATKQVKRKNYGAPKRTIRTPRELARNDADLVSEHKHLILQCEVLIKLLSI